MKMWFLRWLCTLLIMICMIIAFSYILITSNISSEVDINSLPKSALEVFYHNFPFPFLFSIPYAGFLYAVFSLFTSSIIIAVSLVDYGITYTALKLLHMPLEVFCLVGLIHVKHMKQYIVHSIICTLLLLLSAYIEIRL